MSWLMMNVNEMLHDEITKMNYTLIPPGIRGDVHTIRMMQDSLTKIVNQLGEQSSKAQGLNKVITTAEKLSKCPAHILYLLKDPNASNGAGCVIGMLKVGEKRLYLFDDNARMCEAEPLCVLDFYIRPEYQRRGYGKKLFDFMLKDQASSPERLAIDGPSEKMAMFLRRCYGLVDLVRQANNFAVAPSFFQLAPINRGAGRSATPLTPSVGRYTAPKPASAIARVIHGGGGSDNGSVSGKREEYVPETPEPVVEPERRPEPEPVAEPEVAASVAPSASVTPPLRPSSLPVDAAGNTLVRRDSSLTDQGFFDIKFYHNKLW